MDTEKTLDLNKPLFSYSRYEMETSTVTETTLSTATAKASTCRFFLIKPPASSVSKGVSISDFTQSR